MEFIRVNHSVIDGVALNIETPLGRIVHTGDFKISHTHMCGMITDVNRFARLGEEGVLVLLSDSTNVEKPGYTVSDREIGKTLDTIISQSRGRVIVALFASSIARIQQIVDIAQKRGRKIVFNGRSLHITASIARDMGYLRIDPDDGSSRPNRGE